MTRLPAANTSATCFCAAYLTVSNWRTGSVAFGQMMSENWGSAARVELAADSAAPSAKANATDHLIFIVDKEPNGLVKTYPSLGPAFLHERNSSLSRASLATQCVTAISDAGASKSRASDS